MAKLRINGDSSGYVDLEAPNAASSSTLDLDQLPQKNVANTFTANNTFSSNSYFGSEGVRLSTDGSGELGVGYGQTATTKRFSVYNGTSNRFSISPEGYVTTPNQPSFCAYDIQTTSGDIRYGSTWHNEGNHFNTTTGVFTAPITGVYHFSFSALMGNPVNSSHYTRLLWKINGNYNTRYGDTLDDRNKSAVNASGNAEYWPNQLSLTFKLSANDTITVYNDGSQKVYGAQYGHFSGHLVG